MKGSQHLGTYFGIPVTVHWSFVFLPILTIIWAISKGASFETTLLLLGLVLLVFICVVFHEFGHALMAKRFGVRTRDIILLPICGIARLEKLPDRPGEELLVALAGPVVNLIIAGIVAISLFFLPSSYNLILTDLSNARVTLASIPFLVVAFNMAMVVCNLFPIFPMDGGRILRSILATRLQKNTATKLASYIGQFFALVIVILGLYYQDYVLTFTGAMVFVLAARERRIAQHNQLLYTTPVSDIMLEDFTLLHPEDTIPFAQNRVNNTSESCFVVVDSGEKILGYVTKGAINNADKDDHVKSLLSFIPVHLKATTTIAEATKHFDTFKVPILPVIEENKIIGTLEINAND